MYRRPVFLDRLQSQEELIQLIEKCMKDTENLSFPDFCNLTENISSTFFLCVNFKMFDLYSFTYFSEGHVHYTKIFPCIAQQGM